MHSFLASSIRPAAAAGLLFGLVACADLLQPAPSLADQASGAPCQKAVAQVPVPAAPILVATDGVLLAQALPGSPPSQPAGAEIGVPACTYDPVVPGKAPIIRGLW